ncbi:outer membrane protein assembly factor BamB family protein [Aeoliella mucimassa]|uniref:Outer membrane protein assembly factor BamB n=1 Tax=Aeoliella mucimassa TaxID=2527972 RepID=A0A518AV22_9BACT|nr:PQQ-binding-like beta-propeller repeat protein [Aeoliella mucimassa]QDU58571.1 Outer membrane protein assembly factor BamB precursor [Aeoliella mucimassa]
MFMKQPGNTERFTIVIRCSLLLCVGLFVSTACQADDWLYARGTAASNGVAASPLTPKPTELWRYEAPDTGFEATAVVKDGIAYLGDVNGTFHAVNIETGKAVWTKAFDDSGFLSAAAIDGDHLFVGDYNGVLRCLAMADGTERWQVELSAELMAGPMVHQGKVLATTESGHFTKHEADTGKQIGEFVIDAPLRCTPTIVDGRAMLAGCDSKLHAIDIETFKEVDSLEIDGPTGCTPAAIGSRIYFGTEEGSFFAIDTGKSPFEVLWKYVDRRRRQGIRTAAAVSDKLAIYGSQGKAVFAIDVTTGKSAWTFPTRTRVDSSPVIAGSVAVAATQRGKLHLIDLESGEETWQFDAGNNFVASPTVVDGKLLIGNTGGILFCFGEQK